MRLRAAVTPVVRQRAAIATFISTFAIRAVQYAPREFTHRTNTRVTRPGGGPAAQPTFNESDEKTKTPGPGDG